MGRKAEEERVAANEGARRGEEERPGVRQKSRQDSGQEASATQSRGARARVLAHQFEGGAGFGKRSERTKTGPTGYGNLDHPGGRAAGLCTTGSWNISIS